MQSFNFNTGTFSSTPSSSFSSLTPSSSLSLNPSSTSASLDSALNSFNAAYKTGTNLLGAIIGGVVGGIVFIIILIVICCCCCCKKPSAKPVILGAGPTNNTPTQINVTQQPMMHQPVMQPVMQPAPVIINV